MNPWTLEELQTANNRCSLNIEDSGLEKQFDKFGGVPRSFLADDQTSKDLENCKSLLLTFILLINLL
jgi:hypothetical protein